MTSAPMAEPQNTTCPLLIVIVNWRSATLAIACLASLEPELALLPGARVALVENASGDAPALRDAIATHGWQDWVTLIVADRNGGFAYGNNQAIIPELAGPSPPRYFLLLNPDTYIYPGAVRILLEFMAQRPTAGIAGSRLEHPDGQPQRSSFRFPSVWSEMEGGFRLGLISRLLQRWIVAPPVPAGLDPVATDWVAGASMIIRREIFTAIGPLDETYFMYFEEVDFCRRAARAGWPCWYVPRSRVVHLVGQSSGVTDSTQSRKRRPAYWFESRQRYFQTHLGPWGAAAADLLWILGFSSYRLRQPLTRRPDTTPERLLRDFIHHSIGSRRRASAPARPALVLLGDQPASAPAQAPVSTSASTSVSPPAAASALLEQAAQHLPPLPPGDSNGNPVGISFWALVREDYRTHGRRLGEQGFWALAVHRFGNWRMGIRSRWLRAPMTLLYRLLFKWVEISAGITLPYTVQVGRRVRLWHHSGMILHARAIGDDVHIRHNTTFGVAHRNVNRAIPTIGDRVDIGCGACILGHVQIGHDSVIGANAVVLNDVPPYSLAVGIPARVIRQLGPDSDPPPAASA